MKIVFIGDNRNRLNWGCRGTSIALKDMLSLENDIIFTAHGDLSSGNYPIWQGIHLPVFIQRILIALTHKNRFIAKIFRKIGVRDFVTSDVHETLNNFNRSLFLYSVLEELDANIRQCDALVINGEGSFIFTDPHRRDTIFYLMLLNLAQLHKKDTYCLNAMFSDCPKSGRNNETLKKATDILSQCNLVVAREVNSLNYINKLECNINVKYVPDALFSWSKYKEYIDTAINFPLTFVPFPEYDNYRTKFDFIQPYICVSGSSSAAWNQGEAVLGYTRLLEALKDVGYRIFIVPTCAGDQFLCDVANRTKLPIVPVQTNILAGMAILSNATVFLSGRWHPSILASLGGTPCVVFGSNSHKTKSFIEFMSYSKNKKEYKDIPDETEIKHILDDVRDYVQQGSVLRNEIRNKVNELSELTNFYKYIK